MSVRGVKKIAQILDISPRTVEDHINNVLLKIGFSSQESVKDFVETEIVLIKQRYVDLQIQHLFYKQIDKIVRKVKQTGISCVVDSKKNLKLIRKIIENSNEI